MHGDTTHQLDQYRETLETKMNEEDAVAATETKAQKACKFLQARLAEALPAQFVNAKEMAAKNG